MADFEKYWKAIENAAGYDRRDVGCKDSARAAYEAGQASERTATTPVIEAAEGMSRICFNPRQTTIPTHPTDYYPEDDCGECEGCRLTAALATYRAAVTKDDQKPSQEEKG